VFRGEEAEGLVTIASSKWFEAVVVGRVCTEYYDVEVGSGEHSRTVTREAIAYEVWLPIETAPGEQSVRLAVPPDAPFSYEGDTLSFGWEVVARARRRHGLDALAAQKIKISP
jgi:hypothetical protein